MLLLDGDLFHFQNHGFPLFLGGVQPHFFQPLGHRIDAAALSHDDLDRPLADQGRNKGAQLQGILIPAAPDPNGQLLIRNRVE